MRCSLSEVRAESSLPFQCLSHCLNENRVGPFFLYLIMSHSCLLSSLLFVALSSSTVPLKTEINAIVDEILCGSTKDYTFNNTLEFIISVTDLPHNFAKSPPRFHVECSNCDQLYPAIIIFKQDRGVTSLQLPLVTLGNEQKAVFNETERTLCPFESYSSKNITSGKSPSNVTHDDLDNTLIVSLSTSNKRNISISLEVNVVNDFMLELDVNKTITLTPSSPVFYLYEFSSDPNEVSVVLKAESELSHCMIMSIQNKSCPLFDRRPMFHNGYYQTVTYLGAMVVTRDEFPLGFYVAFSLCADDSYCSSQMSGTEERSKTFVLSLTRTASVQFYMYVVLGTVLVILIFCAAMIMLVNFCFMRKDVIVPNLEAYYPTDSCDASTSAPLQEADDVMVTCSPEILSPTTVDAASIRTDSSLDETDVDLLQDIEEDKNIFRTKITLYLSDLAKKNPTVLKKKSELYMWNLTTVSIFYGLPACQLVFRYQNNLKQSGNIDLCYYNFLCSHHFSYLYDFNHVFSNIGYIALGTLFLIITYRKETTHNMLIAQSKVLDRHFGVPRHFGLFYAMGISLIIEGVLSACYHICPNIYNFQFDVSFMYIISTLCMIKIYQSRHPDVNATAYSTFFVIALVLFFNFWGIFTPSNLFWITEATVHVGAIFYISLHIYYVGRCSFDVKAVVRYLKEFRFRLCLSRYFWRPVYPTRFVLLAVINLCNWILDVIPFFMDVKDFSSHLLLIFIANLVLYTSFYIIMKIVSGEKILLQPLVYIVLAVLTWSAALYYFFHKTITWKKTPAESRMYNKPCELFNFYDNHDIWHFLSSAGLFFSFLVLLTLDDDLIYVDRCRIPVF